jgi:hypothetical protein
MKLSNKKILIFLLLAIMGEALSRRKEDRRRPVPSSTDAEESHWN